MTSARMYQIIKLTPFMLAIGLTACSSDSGSSAQTKPASPSPVVSIDAIKSYSFSWSQVADTSYYKLLENADGMSGFKQVGDNIASSATSYEHIIPLYNRLNAEYILQACNNAGCSGSSTLVPAPTASQLKAAIGYVKASNTEEADSFGTALSISGDGQTLAVSAIYEDSNATGIDGDESDNSASNAGAVYVFTRLGSTWSQQAYLKSSNTAAEDQFGKAISLSEDGSSLAVGAPQDNTGTSNSGSVYVFTRSGSTWTQQDSFQPDDTASGIMFGSAVSLSDDGSILAASTATFVNLSLGIRINSAAYIFTQTNNTWSQKQKLASSNAEDEDEFGTSLSLSGDGATLVVGALGEASDGSDQTDNTEANAGAAYVFVADASGTWSQQAYLKASNAGSYDYFGAEVSLSQDGSALVVSSYKEDSDGSSEANESKSGSGSAYVFTRTGTTWSQQAYLKASNPDEADYFGNSVSMSGDGSTIAVAAYAEESNATGISTNSTGESDNSATVAGAVYVFTRSGTAWSQIAYIKASNAEEDDQFGNVVSLSNDAGVLAVAADAESSNATGVGGDQGDNSLERSGAVYLY